MAKKISYKNISEKQTTVIQTLNYNYKELNGKYTVLLQNQKNMEELLDTIGIKSNYEDLCNFFKFLYENKEDFIEYVNIKKNKDPILESKNNKNDEKDKTLKNDSINTNYENVINNDNIEKKDKKVTIEGSLEYNSIENSINSNNTNININGNSVNIETSSNTSIDENKKSAIQNNDSKKKKEKINKYNLENAISLFDETVKINKNLEINKEINDDIDFKIVLEDIYINRYDKIKVLSNLYYYIEEEDKNYINEINKIYNIDTIDKKKKLNQKIKRCHQFINSLQKIDEYDKIVKTNLTPTFLISLKKEDFNSFTNYIENYKI
jgi:hypothetical protein